MNDSMKTIVAYTASFLIFFVITALLFSFVFYGSYFIAAFVAWNFVVHTGFLLFMLRFIIVFSLIIAIAIMVTEGAEIAKLFRKEYLDKDTK